MDLWSIFLDFFSFRVAPINSIPTVTPIWVGQHQLHGWHPSNTERDREGEPTTESSKFSSAAGCVLPHIISYIV